ncbi:MAG: glycosyltransferase family 39 protein [Microgenomates group bacterium]
MFDIHKMFSYLKKHFTVFDVLLLGGIKILYLVTRIYNLKLLPIFTDEGIYIRWAKVAWHDASWRFISLTDGKQPLQTWGTIPFLKLFPNDALLAGRLFSVMTGMIALLGLFALLIYLFDKKTAFIGAFLYVFSPYFLFYDRMALVDSGVNAAFIWIILFTVLLVNTVRLDVALLFGIGAGIALLTKSTAQMFLGVSFIASLFLFEYKKKKASGFMSYLFLWGIVFALSQVIYNVQRLSPYMHYLAMKNTTFVMTFSDWLRHPFEVLFSNLKIIPYYVFSESGWIVVPFAFVGLYFLLRKNIRLFFFFSILLFIPYFGIAAMTRVLFPRYIIFFGTLLTIFTAYLLGKIKDNRIAVALIGFIISILIVFQFPMWTDYTKIMFPDTDKGQYIVGVTVGKGMDEIIAFAREKSKEKPVRIIAEGDFGLTGDMLDVYVRQGENVFIQGYWPLNKEALLKHQADIGKEYIYVVTAHELAYPTDWPMKLLKTYYKSGNASAIQLFELTK